MDTTLLHYIASRAFYGSVIITSTPFTFPPSPLGQVCLRPSGAIFFRYLDTATDLEFFNEGAESTGTEGVGGGGVINRDNNSTLSLTLLWPMLPPYPPTDPRSHSWFLIGPLSTPCIAPCSPVGVAGEQPDEVATLSAGDVPLPSGSYVAVPPVPPHSSALCLLLS